MSTRPLDGPRGADYLRAARRKIEIAKYHLEHLLARLETNPEPIERSDPPIDVQAHFEGVLFSVKAEIDQITELIANALNCPYRKALAECSERLPELKAWRKDAFFDELNELRRLAAHHAYVKRPAGPEQRWIVDDVGSSYEGPRELGPYCKAAVAYGEKLMNLTEAAAAQLVSTSRV
jgi:hypothetical protein